MKSSVDYGWRNSFSLHGILGIGEKLKVDLVMWTYNSAKTLETCLSSIDRAIPAEAVCHKIAVDGGSEDDTTDILRRYGWTVEISPRRGIPYQANLALGKVDTEFFASFEHDIVLNSNWFVKMSRAIESESMIGAVQGVRLYVGSKTMQAIEEARYRARRLPVWTYSVDNTLFRTKAVQHAGGFSDECMASTDGILRRNMFRLGYRWITDNNLISGHYRKNFFEQFNHQMKTFELATYYWSPSAEKRNLLRRIVSTLGGNPIHGLRLAFQTRMLRVPMAWYILRLQAGIWLNLPHEAKLSKATAMDDWYLSRFKKVVIDSSEKHRVEDLEFREASMASSKSICAWCGKRAEITYTIPTDWGNVVPKFNPGIQGKFAACSDSHAGNVAEKIFKEAFDYVTPNGRE
ncbi:MAG TPA: glycosyltransferase [Candidatus Bathyarchaeia archaeon]|nr:glycosyltransferase [Candidatus Bathyarchaeia archaeon]